MDIELISEKKDGYVIKRTYSCPCGKGYVEEEQDYTPGHRDGFAWMSCAFCDKHYLIDFGSSLTKWKVVPKSKVQNRGEKDMKKLEIWADSFHEGVSDADVRDFYNVCLSASIRTVSRATTQQGRLFLDVVTAKKDCLDTFVKKAKKVILAVSALPNKKVDLEISAHNAGESFDLDEVNNLIIVHPPYFNSYKYSSVNSLELAWMRVDHASVRKNEVREFFKVGKAEKIACYVDDMSKTLNNVVATMKPGGIMALMIGDTIIKGEYIQATKMLLDRFLAENPQIKVEKIVLRVPKYTEASWSASQRRKSDKVGISLNDFIVIFRRGT